MTSAASSSDRLRPLRRQPGDSRRTRGPSRHSLTARAANGSSGRVDGAGSALPCSSRTIAENQTPSSRRRSATSSRSSGADRLRARRRPWPRTRNGAFLALRCRQARHMRRAAAASRHSAAASCPGPGWSRKVQAPPSSSRPSRADSGAAPRAAPMLIRLGTLATKRRNRVASSSLAPVGQGACVPGGIIGFPRGLHRAGG